MIVRCGVMAIEEVEEGSSIELEKPAPGDIFGERAVLMDPRTLRRLARTKGVTSRPRVSGLLRPHRRRRPQQRVSSMRRARRRWRKR